MEHIENTTETCIIVVDVQGKLIGVLVDQVSEVLDIRGEDIEDAPNIGVGIDTGFILGLGTTKGGVKILLDIDKDLCDSDYVALDGIAVGEGYEEINNQTGAGFHSLRPSNWSTKCFRTCL